MDPSALGRYLRESREAKEVTLEDAVRALRIRRDILEAFERGEFSVMDSAVRVRGMLRNYAHYLGLEEERVLQYYESAHNKTRGRRLGRREIHVEPIAPRRITDTPPTLPAVPSAPQPASPSQIVDILRNIAMILVAIAAIAVIAFVMMDRLGIMDEDPAVAIVPSLVPGSISETPTNTPTITPRATILTDTPVPALGVAGVQVDLEIGQRSWVTISVDEREEVVGFLEPGFTATYVGNDSVLLRAANAAALDIIYNGIPQDTFGARGQEVEIRFSNTGVEIMQNPVGSVLPTATPLALLTPTSDVDANPPSAAAAQSQVTPIPTAIVPTPTPLFSSSEPVENASIAAQDETTAPTPTENSESTPLPTEAQIEPSATPQATETSSVVLPIRETPANPTPTKTG